MSVTPTDYLEHFPAHLFPQRQNARKMPILAGVHANVRAQPFPASAKCWPWGLAGAKENKFFGGSPQLHKLVPALTQKTGLGLLWILRGHWKWICYADAQMAIELDDGQHLHNPDACGRDQRKNVLLQQNGYRVLRFLCEDVGRCLDEVLDAIIRALSHRAEQEHDKQQSEWNSFDRITTDITRMNGEPCIRNFRLTALRVFEALAIYPDRAERKREYPELEDEDIRQALAFAAASSRSPSLAPAYDAMRLLLDQSLPRLTVLYLRLLSWGVTS